MATNDEGESSQFRDSVRSIINDSVADLTSNLSSVIEAKFGELKTEISATPTVSLVGDQFNFKNKGNKQQYLHESRVLESLRLADNALGSSDVVKAKAALQEGMSLVKKRIKLIRLAEKSEFGWATVNEYLSDELASDSEDEKRLFRSEKRAERRLKQAQIKRNKNRQRPPYQARVSNRYGSSSSWQQSALSHQSPSTASASRSSRQIGPCFKLSFIFGHVYINIVFILFLV